MGLGCIICLDNDSCIIEHVKALGVMYNNLANLEALIEGLTLSGEICGNKLVIERDLQIILNIFKKRETKKWILNSKLVYALAIIDKLLEIINKNVYREWNREDNLTNKRVDE